MEKILNFDNHIHAGIMAKTPKAEAFINKAIEKGLSHIVISDHAPLPQSTLGDRIPDGMTAEYCRRIRELADKYKGKIDIKAGIEIDYFPGFEREIEGILKEGDFDLVMGSSHLHVKGMLDVPLDTLTAQEYVDRCFDNNIAAVKSGYFDVLAHVDMYRWIIAVKERFKLRTSDYAIPGEKLETLLSEMSKRGTSLEINTNFMGDSGDTSKIYPSEEIMAKASKYPLTYSFGSDAHAPQRVGDGIAGVTAAPWFAGCFDKFVRV